MHDLRIDDKRKVYTCSSLNKSEGDLFIKRRHKKTQLSLLTQIRGGVLCQVDPVLTKMVFM